MHIPDGFLSTNALVPAWIVSVSTLGYCLKKAQAKLKDKIIPLMGVSSAFIFAGQMLNFPIAAGTSGHLLGGVLAAVLLGPYIGPVVIAVVLFVQCFIFQDGGITALGANIFNMAILGTIGGYFIYRHIRIFKGDKGIMFSVAVASWCSVVFAAAACAIELAISGISPFNLVFPAMVGVHALIGIGEAIITTLIVSFIIKTRPDLIYKNE